DLPDAFAFAQRALAIAANFARAAGLILRFFLPPAAAVTRVLPAAACTLAQRALWAAAMRARAAGDIVRLPVRPVPDEVGAAAPPSEPARRSNSASNSSILSLISTTFRSCAELRF